MENELLTWLEAALSEIGAVWHIEPGTTRQFWIIVNPEADYADQGILNFNTPQELLSYAEACKEVYDAGGGRIFWSDHQGRYVVEPKTGYSS